MLSSPDHEPCRWPPEAVHTPQGQLVEHFGRQPRRSQGEGVGELEGGMREGLRARIGELVEEQHSVHRRGRFLGIIKSARNCNDTQCVIFSPDGAPHPPPTLMESMSLILILATGCNRMLSTSTARPAPTSSHGRRRPSGSLKSITLRVTLMRAPVLPPPDAGAATEVTRVGWYSAASPAVSLPDFRPLCMKCDKHASRPTSPVHMRRHE